MKRFVSLLVLLTLAFSVFAAYVSDEWTEVNQYRKEPPYVIGFSNSFMGISWRTQFMAEFQEMVKAFGPVIKEVYVTNADNQIAKQIADIEDLLAKGVDGLVVDPVSPSALVPVIERAYEMGIPVVIINDKINTEKIAAYRSTDDFEFGRAGGEWLVKQLNGKGKVVALRGIAGHGVDEDRWAGAMSAFKEHPGIKVVAQEFAGWSYDKGKIAMQNILAAHPDVAGVWSSGGAMSRAAVDVLLESGHELIPVTGEDENGFLKKWAQLRDKGFSSIAPSKPTWITRVGLDTLINLLMGVPVPKVIIYPTPLITDENLDKYVKPDLPDTYWANSLLFEDQVKKLLAGQ
ncbi:MAG: ABC transporter substrate-binding protein [Thermotogae bacterium]|nr:ABC transporter substrate-binding protein [Thermotogota bacterium]